MKSENGGVSEALGQPSIIFENGPSFLRALKKLLKKYPLIADDIESLTAQLENTPQMGEPLGRDCYKIRMAISGKQAGKSGGARVVTCVKIVHSTVYFLTLFDKAEQESITDRRILELLKEVGLA